MNPQPPPAMSEVSQAFCILSVLLLPLALAGLALINTGLSRLRSAAHSMMAALVLLRATLARNIFVTAGLGVEILGLVLFTRAHLMAKGGNE